MSSIPVLLESQIRAAQEEAGACKSSPEHQYVIVKVEQNEGKTRAIACGTASAGMNGKPFILASAFSDGVLAINRQKLQQCYIAYKRFDGACHWARLAICAIPEMFTDQRSQSLINDLEVMA